MAITRAQQVRQMYKEGSKKPAMQGGGPNYLGKQPEVTTPRKWKSSPDHPDTELAYITEPEKKVLIALNMHGGLEDGKPNKGPNGIISLQGDLGGYDASPGGPDRNRDSGGQRVGQADKNKQRAKDIMTGKVKTKTTTPYRGPKGDDLVKLDSGDYVAKKDLKNVTSVGGVNQPLNVMNVMKGISEFSPFRIVTDKFFKPLLEKIPGRSLSEMYEEYGKKTGLSEKQFMDAVLSGKMSTKGGPMGGYGFGGVDSQGNPIFTGGGGGQDQPIVPIVPTTTGVVDNRTDLEKLLDARGAAYRFFADGGRVPAQQGGIMPRLNELSGGVSSAEQMLQEINQRLESAESSLGEGGGMQQPGLPGLGPTGLKLDQPFKGETFSQIPEQYKAGFDEYTKENPIGIGGQAMTSVGLPDGNRVMFGDTGSAGAFGDYLKSIGAMPDNPFGPRQIAPNMTGQLNSLSRGAALSPLASAMRPFADGGRADDEEDYVGGIMDLESARQMYGLGKLVKKVTRGIKKIAKSPVGKVALLAGGAGLLSKAGFGLPSFLSKKSLSNFFLKDAAKGFSLGNLTQKGLLTGIGGISALAGLMTPKEQEEEEQYLGPTIDIAGIRQNPYAAMGEAYNFYADGGKAEPVAKKTMPLLDMDGMEKDYRADGGFVPIGRMERADDVPARLSKNEFVFTADAVRNAGDGDVDKGAEVMYNMMKNLEAGGNVSEESQGLDGARKMFQTSQRLEEVL